MGVSEAVFQKEFEFAKDTVQLGAKLFGARYHPFSMRTVLWQRVSGGAMDLFLEVVEGDRVYIVDQVLATVLKSYVFPNARTPEKVDLVPGARYRFRTLGAPIGEDQSVVTTWAELGAP